MNLVNQVNQRSALPLGLCGKGVAWWWGLGV